MKVNILLCNCNVKRCSDKHQFHVKMTVSTQTFREISLLNIVVVTRYEKWHFRYRTLLRLAVFHVAFGHL